MEPTISNWTWAKRPLPVRIWEGGFYPEANVSVHISPGTSSVEWQVPELYMNCKPSEFCRGPVANNKTVCIRNWQIFLRQGGLWWPVENIYAADWCWPRYQMQTGRDGASVRGCSIPAWDGTEFYVSEGELEWKYFCCETEYHFWVQYDKRASITDEDLMDTVRREANEGAQIG